MKKVSILLSGLRFGGAEKVSLNLAQAFQNKGYVVDILVLKKTGELIELAEKNFNLNPLSKISLLSLIFCLIFSSLVFSSILNSP